ncbi:MAG: bifunctional YncE family protein/alkaline phosphatase family protein [Pyrinomonadaceae bacterium]
MSNTKARRRSSGTLYAAFIITLALLAASGFLTSHADITTTPQPVSGKKPLTPAGSLVFDATTRQPAVGALPVDFVRSPDTGGADGAGRYLVAVNSGFGLHFNAASNRAQQSLAVIDLNARPAPAVIQNIYFPTPQSVNVGVCFAPQAEPDGNYTLYVSGGFENKIWMFSFRPGANAPVSPAPTGSDAAVKAPFIDVSGFTDAAPTPRYNDNHAPVYPTGLAVSADGNTLFVANNLGDSLGIISDLRGTRSLTRVDLHGANREQNIYPYGVAALPARNDRGNPKNAAPQTRKVYVSCWNTASIAVVDLRTPERTFKNIAVGQHPTVMLADKSGTRLYVVNTNDDTVSVIDTSSDHEIERISVRLSEESSSGSSPESLALSADEATLYVANAHSNTVAVVALNKERAKSVERDAGEKRNDALKPPASRVRGFIPTGQYPSAIAVVGRELFIGNGKGTGFENSSVIVNDSGRAPNVPNDRFPVGRGRGSGQGGEYSAALIAGNISRVAAPDERTLARYTEQAMRNNNLLGVARAKLFSGKSPIKHVIYVIRENRTYDQVFGDVERAGDNRRADGDPALAIFGAGDAARSPGGAAQNITPNARALALRFGLMDRFFVNSEASPDGHNWSTAAFSTDYVDKAFRWDYGGRGRGYDYEGFNRLPDYNPGKDTPPLFRAPVNADDIAAFMRRFIPYLHDAKDVAEPSTLYLWDAAARASLSYRNYGEFIGTISAADVAAINANRAKSYPDISPTISAVPTKKSLEGHHSTSFRTFDMNTPDALTVASYRAAKENRGSGGRGVDPLINEANSDEKFRGASRLGAWLEEFRGFVADLEAGRGDRLPNLSMLRLCNDHTAGLAAGKPTPQFFVAENDYAIGRLVEAVSHSPYWKDTAIVLVEDDAQDGADHVDCHRSVALVISAYNRPGALVHEYHTTVSLIRTMEMLLGIAPMNELDRTATPIDMFRAQADLRPYTAELPSVALDNLMAAPARDRETARWMQRTREQDFAHPDMADARTLNEIIWFSVRGARSAMPRIARFPAYEAMPKVVEEESGEDEEETFAASNYAKHR